jgi:acetoin utilization deacetylase AcuC-like enzyme
MEKYDLLPKQLVYEGTVTRSNFFSPDDVSVQLIGYTHKQIYIDKLLNLELSRSEERRTGFPLTKTLIDREIKILSGSVQGVEYALEFGASMNIAGGTHHAFTDKGEGFCLLNDQAVAANYLLHEKGFGKILIIDLDVHQGNGTAEIFEKEERVFTFSMHGAKNYPLHKERSDWDVALPDGTGDKVYIETLQNSLERLFDLVQPEFVFYQSGVDVLKTDKLGRLALSMNGCRMRDELVVKKCKENNVPLFVSMGGGYSQRIAHIIEAHANTFRSVSAEYF